MRDHNDSTTVPVSLCVKSGYMHRQQTSFPENSFANTQHHARVLQAHWFLRVAQTLMGVQKTMHGSIDSQSLFRGGAGISKIAFEKSLRTGSGQPVVDAGPKLVPGELRPMRASILGCFA